MTNEEKYARLIQAVEDNDLKTKFDVVAWCIGFFKIVDEETFDLIQKLYMDGFINE